MEKEIKINIPEGYELDKENSTGFARVELNGKYNFIDTKDNILSKQWFDYAYNFSNGFAMVKLDYKYNFIDTKGNLLSKVWYAKRRAIFSINGKTL